MASIERAKGWPLPVLERRAPREEVDRRLAAWLEYRDKDGSSTNRDIHIVRHRTLGAETDVQRAAYGASEAGHVLLLQLDSNFGVDESYMYILRHGHCAVLDPAGGSGRWPVRMHPGDDRGWVRLPRHFRRRRPGGITCAMIKNAFFRLALMAVVVQIAGCAPGGPQLEQAGRAQATAMRSDPQSGSGTYRPPSQNAGVRTQSMVPGRPGRVFIFVAVDKDCQPLPAPELMMTRPPGKGKVSFRPGQKTKLAASAGGTCLGVSASGTGVYYTARAGSAGADSFSVTAQLASGETMTRDFQVQIAE